MDQLAQTVARIITERNNRSPFLVAIEGRCAAGKTTLAHRLEGLLPCSVIHMDHFFLRPEQRTEGRLSTPGENVDHERFLREILLPLRQGETVSYRPFSCKTMTLEAPLSVKKQPIYVIEGSYCCHPLLREYYDLRLFLDVDPKEQMNRILGRNGKEGAEQFQNRWIPLEEQYISRYCSPNVFDLRFLT